MVMLVCWGWTAKCRLGDVRFGTLLSVVQIILLIKSCQFSYEYEYDCLYVKRGDVLIA